MKEGVSSPSFIAQIGMGRGSGRKNQGELPQEQGTSREDEVAFLEKKYFGHAGAVEGIETEMNRQGGIDKNPSRRAASRRNARPGSARYEHKSRVVARQRFVEAAFFMAVFFNLTFFCNESIFRKILKDFVYTVSCNALF